MSVYEHLPYRPCVGTMVLNREGGVFIGRRTGGPEQVDTIHAWQMPQGGLDPGEDAFRAALRELCEETNIRSVELIAESREWLTYDLPPELVPGAWGGRYRGQTQKWYALRFTGEDSEIDIAFPGGHEPEFVEWRWARMRELPDLIVPFKRKVYERIVAEFGHLAENDATTR
jgi:putative (di)nucleoside polyphosphate hydrolase